MTRKPRRGLVVTVHPKGEKLNRGQSKKVPEFAEDLIAMASNAIAVDLMLGSEARALAIWRNQLSHCSAAMKRIFDAYNLLVGKEADGEALLNCALTAAFMIGSRISDSPINARLLREGAAKATRAKREKSRIIDLLISNLGRDIWMRYPKRSNSQLANALLEDLNRMLSERGCEVLKPNTVEKRIRRLRTIGRSSE